MAISNKDQSPNKKRASLIEYQRFLLIIYTLFVTLLVISCSPITSQTSTGVITNHSITISSNSLANSDTSTSTFSANTTASISRTTTTTTTTTTIRAKVYLNKNTFEGYKNDQVTLIASIYPESEQNTPVTWSSSNNTVASVDKNGKVILNSGGAAIIRVSLTNGEQASCSITVRDPKLSLPTTPITINQYSSTQSNLVLSTVQITYIKCTITRNTALIEISYKITFKKYEQSTVSLHIKVTDRNSNIVDEFAGTTLGGTGKSVGSTYKTQFSVKLNDGQNSLNLYSIK